MKIIRALNVFISPQVIFLFIADSGDHPASAIETNSEITQDISK
jgi:hypothetical protein